MSNGSSYLWARLHSSNQKQKIQQRSFKALAGVPLYIHSEHSLSLANVLQITGPAHKDVSQISNIKLVAREGCKSNVHNLPQEIAKRGILFELI